MKKVSKKTIFFIAICLLLLFAVYNRLIYGYPDIEYSGDFVATTSTKASTYDAVTISGNSGLYVLHTDLAAYALVKTNKECISLGVTKAAITATGIAYVDSEGRLFHYTDGGTEMIATGVSDMCWNGENIIFSSANNKSVYMQNDGEITSLIDLDHTIPVGHVLANEHYVVIVDKECGIHCFEIGGSETQTFDIGRGSLVGNYYLIDHYLIMVGIRPGGKVFDLKQGKEFDLDLGGFLGWDMDTTSTVLLRDSKLYISYHSRRCADWSNTFDPYTATYVVSIDDWTAAKINETYYPVLFYDDTGVWGVENLRSNSIKQIVSK